ncbi:hypothetical protein K504DRAFT_249907 [Pleomassaria siparia CBS 279.74]|uniref:Uncharacterized protein n=1 Tax=Pleomassaria siparia CBS 279.74 TaxID=1314801 RepID=A0A6G1KCE5_9PLEO|nr:hypothetical protein K504DRAFT_249907 [Pleomassaria siparia CBS 279.74]
MHARMDRVQPPQQHSAGTTGYVSCEWQPSGETVSIRFDVSNAVCPRLRLRLRLRIYAVPLRYHLLSLSLSLSFAPHKHRKESKVDTHQSIYISLPASLDLDRDRRLLEHTQEGIPYKHSINPEVVELERKKKITTPTTTTTTISDAQVLPSHPISHHIPSHSHSHSHGTNVLQVQSIYTIERTQFRGGPEEERFTYIHEPDVPILFLFLFPHSRARFANK